MSDTPQFAVDCLTESLERKLHTIIEVLEESNETATRTADALERIADALENAEGAAQ
jgi:methionyl-tRNA formyltransferase